MVHCLGKDHFRYVTAVSRPVPAFALRLRHGRVGPALDYERLLFLTAL